MTLTLATALTIGGYPAMIMLAVVYLSPIVTRYRSH